MAFFPFRGYGEFSGYPYPPVGFAPAFWVLDIQPAWYGHFSWMQTDIMHIWQHWQQTLAQGHYSLKERRALLREELVNNTMLSNREIKETLDRIMSMEQDLDANQYGVVDTTIQSTTTTTTTTTSRFTQDQLNEAATQYLNHLNQSGATIDPQEAQQRRNQILSGQADMLAEVMLQQRQSNVVQQNQQQQQLIQQHGTPQQNLLQQPSTPSAQYGIQKQSAFQQQNTAPQNAMEHLGTQQQQIPQAAFRQQAPAAPQNATQYQGMQQSGTQFPTLPSAQAGFQPRLGQGHLQNASQQMQSMITTTTTTTSNSSDYQAPIQSMMSGHQQGVPVHGQTQPPQQTRPLQIASAPNTPATHAQFNQQQMTPPGMQTPNAQSYFPQQLQQQPSGISQAPMLAHATRPDPPSSGSSAKEQRDARMAERAAKKKK